MSDIAKLARAFRMAATASIPQSMQPYGQSQQQAENYFMVPYDPGMEAQKLAIYSVLCAIAAAFEEAAKS